MKRNSILFCLKLFITKNADNKINTVIVFSSILFAKVQIVNGNESQTNNETFTVPLPEKAKLNITSVKHVVLGTKDYLNITVENVHYSAINLTISKIVVTFENQTEPSIMQLSPGQTVAIGSETFIFFPIETAPQGNITVEVITDEGIEASWSGVPSS